VHDRLLKRTFNSGSDKTYQDLEASLIEKGCKIKSEEPSKHLLAVQGSLWGVSPKTAKKTLEIDLVPSEDSTKVTWTSRLSSDWKNLTIIGCVFAVVLVGLCVWIAFDLSTFISTNKASFWSSVLNFNVNTGFFVARAFVNLAETLAAFLSVIVAFEVVVFVYVRSRIDRFAENILDTFSGVSAASAKNSKE